MCSGQADFCSDRDNTVSSTPTLFETKDDSPPTSPLAPSPLTLHPIYPPEFLPSTDAPIPSPQPTSVLSTTASSNTPPLQSLSHHFTPQTPTSITGPPAHDSLPAKSSSSTYQTTEVNKDQVQFDFTQTTPHKKRVKHRNIMGEDDT